MIRQGCQVDEADDAVTANKANEAFEASMVGKADEAFAADKANVIDVIVTADEAIATNTANLANEANEASFTKANDSLAYGITIFLYSLTKYCEVFSKDEGYFEITISNNYQLVGRVWSCLRSLKYQHLQRDDIEDGKLLSSSMRVQLCFVLSL